MISIRYKAGLPGGILAILLAILAAVASYAITKIVSTNQSLANRFHEIEDVREIEVAISRLAFPHVAYLSQRNPLRQQEARAILKTMDERVADLRKIASVVARDRKLLDFAAEQLEQIRALSDAFFALPESDRELMTEALHELSTVYLASLSNRLHEWHAVEAEQVNALAKTADLHAQRFRLVAGSLLVLALAMLAIAVWYNNSVLVKPILAISASTARLSEGHFDQELLLHSNDELGRLASNINRMARSLEGSYQRLEHLANTDALTGLMNRRAFDAVAASALAAAKRHGRPLALALIDIDHFKRINDKYGHSNGDLVLKWISAKCTSALRVSDACFRYGGEEFIVILQETRPEIALQTIERCRATIAAEPFMLDDLRIPVTASFGLACFPGDGTELAELVERADAALYAAKAHGRNRVERYRAA